MFYNVNGVFMVHKGHGLRIELRYHFRARNAGMVRECLVENFWNCD